MKRTTTLTAVLLTLLSSLALAGDKFATLANAKDKVTIPAGQTAMVLFVADMPTIQYKKEGKRPVQFQLGLTRPTEARYNYYRGGSAYDARVERNPSSLQPLALAGPCTISMQTDGMVSLQILGADKDDK